MLQSNFFGLMFLSITFSLCADTIPTIPDSVRHRIEYVLNKAGISFDGEFKSGHFGSSISGQGIKSGERTIEADEYSSVDFDIRARPNTSVAGRLILRLHHNWQNFWSNPGNPIFSRWISIDGALLNKIPFHVGNFTMQYTPLTLSMPEPEILFEPEIFIKQRTIAMDEVFLGNHARPLQGVSLGLAIALAPLFEKIHGNIFGVRLRNIETSNSVDNSVTNLFEKSPDFSKLAFGSTLDAALCNKILIGGSFLHIGDNTRNFSSTIASDSIARIRAQRTSIADARIEYDLADMQPLRQVLRGSSLRMYAEAAFSFDDSAWYTGTTYNHSAFPGGRAAYGGLSFKTLLPSVCLIDGDVKYINNNERFRNELAQSPAFIGQRIMNVESDVANNYGAPKGESSIDGNHYSTFDALYHNVFKFCPKEKTNRWSEAPFSKNSYSNIVYTKEELRSLADSGLDPSIQLYMPFGPATPNRRGIDAAFTVRSADSGAQMHAVFGRLSKRTTHVAASGGTEEIFTRAGLGMSCNVSTWVKRLRYPLEASLSFVRTRAQSKESGSSIKNDFLNGGLRFQFWKKTALLGGLQIIENTSAGNALTWSQTQTHWLAGISWKVAETAEVTGSLGEIIVHSPDFSSTAIPIFRYSQGEFSQFLSALSLRVYF